MRARKVAQRSFRVGTGPTNDLRLEGDPTVSGMHFEIRTDDDGFRLVDAGSRNGTFVEGLRVRDVVLPPRCTIRAGATELKFERAGAPSAVALFAGSRFGPAIGASDAMRELFALVEAAAASDATVLLEGESGTGKEVLARAIHETSRRASRPFVVIDCGAIPAHLMEAELFGHVRGAFTGAVGAKAGLLERANRGTVFLDEIGELPIDIQPKLLRALSERTIRRVGGRDRTALDVRVVAATNRELLKEVKRRAFRLDLYYRLAVVRLRVPPLRDRPGDVPLLVEHFTRQLLEGDEARVRGFLGRVDEAAWERLRKHPWPGNVRELSNLVERALALDATLDLTPTPAGALPEAQDAESEVDLGRPFGEQKDEVIRRFEEAYVLGQLERCGGNVSEAARASGMERKHFHRVLGKYRKP